MEKRLLGCLIIMAVVAFSLYTDYAQSAQLQDPFVTTQWLTNNMNAKNIVILDVRTPDYYSKGHIPGAVNVPGLGNFYINLFSKETPWMELPEKEALFAVIGKAGITGDSTVVVVGRTVDPMAVLAIADAARVAITLIYAGVEKVTILNGGYDKWAVEGKATSTDPVIPISMTFTGAENKKMFVTKDYVEKNIGKSILVDARDSDAYFGLSQSPWEKKAGHIPSAKSLPIRWFWIFEKTQNSAITYGAYKNIDTMKEIAHTVLGKNMSKEIIIYCGVGGNAAALYYVLTQSAGYQNVKIFDGSMQVWTDDPKAQVIKYQYQ
jgi:thiosulfate/3-mercaptopyruvate sulfurtransferase